MTFVEWVAELAAHGGVRRVFGSPLPGLVTHVVTDDDAACRLADASGRLDGVGLAHLGSGRLYVTGGSGALTTAGGNDLSAAARVLERAVGAAAAPRPKTTRVDLDIDWDGPAPKQPPRVEYGPIDLVDQATTSRIIRASRPVVLAGPGALRCGARVGIPELAQRRSLGVLNTWGAKGLLDRASPHHFATVGLQERDYVLGGLAEADLIITVGLDPHETVPPIDLAPVVEIDPNAVLPLAEDLPPRSAPLRRPPLFDALAAPAQRGWTDPSVPLMPSRVTHHYGEALGPDGLIVADPGTAGFYVARTFPTSAPGAAIVPGQTGTAGFAVAAALVAGLADVSRPRLAVVDGPLDELSVALLELARQWEVPVPVEEWWPDGEPIAPDAHRARLAESIHSGHGPVPLGYASSQLAAFEAVAGRVTAWTEDRT